jgi:hypothetical protein
MMKIDAAILRLHAPPVPSVDLKYAGRGAARARGGAAGTDYQATIGRASTAGSIST